MQCQVCFNNYDDNAKAPLIYACGHTYCLTCVEGYHRNGCYKCPTCRQTQNTTPVKNFDMIEMLGMYSVINCSKDMSELAQQMNALINESVIHKRKLASLEEEKQNLSADLKAADEERRLECDRKHDLMNEKQKLAADLKVQKDERRWAEEGRDIEIRRKHDIMEERDSAIDMRIEATQANSKLHHILLIKNNKLRSLENELKKVKSQKDTMDRLVGSIAKEEYYVLIDGEYIKKDLEHQYQTTYAFVHAPDWAYEDSGQPGPKFYPGCVDVHNLNISKIRDGSFIDGKFIPMIKSTTKNGTEKFKYVVY